MKKVFHATVAACVLLLVACTSTTASKAPAARTFGIQPPSSSENVYADIPTTLENRDWRLIRVGVDALVKADKDIIMRLERGRAAGYGGCNLYNGRYKYEEARFVFASIVASAHTCTATTVQEQALFKALQQTRYWRIEQPSQHLQFLDKKLQLLVEYELVSKRPPMEAAAAILN